MEEIHQRAIRRSRSEMIEKLDPNHIQEHLHKYEIFPTLVMEIIMNKDNSRIENVKRLLEELPKRKKEDYGNFLKCLKESDYLHLAKFIEDKEREIRSEMCNAPNLQSANPAIVSDSSFQHFAKLSSPNTDDGDTEMAEV